MISVMTRMRVGMKSMLVTAGEVGGCAMPLIAEHWTKVSWEDCSSDMETGE